MEYTKAEVLGESPSRGDAIIGAASAYASLGEKDKALAAYKKYLDSYPTGDKAKDADAAIKKLQG